MAQHPLFRTTSARVFRRGMLRAKVVEKHGNGKKTRLFLNFH